MSRENATFYYGAQYYRPPNPPRSQHRFHLERIKQELGFNLVKLRIQWNSVERKPGDYDIAEYDEIFDICDAIGLGVLAEINLETAPYWLERAHPEARYVSANGHPVELGPYDATQHGGYPGLCFHNAVVEREARRYLQFLIGHIKTRQSLQGYDCWNEPHLEPAWICDYWGNLGDRLYCYCEASRAEFRQWLQHKYGSVAAVNSAWGRNYVEFEDINPPSRHGTYADWLDWIRFWFDSLAAHMKWRYDVIKSCDPERFVMSHSGAVPPVLARANAFINNWALAKPVDKWGTSFAPKGHNWDLGTCAATMDLTRSAAGGKEFWISEMTGGSVYTGTGGLGGGGLGGAGFAKTPITRPKDIRAWNWLAIAYGAKAIMYWCYLEESTGPEAGSFGLIRYNGNITERAREAARSYSLISKYEKVIGEWKPEAQVAILYSPDHSNLLFAMEGTDERYGASHIGYYRSVWQADVFARYVTPEELAGLQEPILILPMCLILDQESGGHILSFVERGGILIAENRTGLFDQRGFLQPDLPGGGLSAAIGIEEGEALYSDPENRPLLNNPHNQPWPDPEYCGPPISFNSPASVEVRARNYLTSLSFENGESIGEWNGQCYAVKVPYGKGTVYYFGTYMGIALHESDPSALQLMHRILSDHIKPEVHGTMLRPRLITGEDIDILAVFNDSRNQVVTERVTLNPNYKSAQNIFTGEEFEIAGGDITVCVQPEDAGVFVLQKGDTP